MFLWLKCGLKSLGRSFSATHSHPPMPPAPPPTSLHPTKDEIARLVELLNSNDLAIAKRAADALDALHYPQFSRRGNGPRVISLDEYTRVSDALKNALRDTDVIDPLIETFQIGTPFAKAYAGPVIGYIGDSRALPLLIDALSDTDVAVRVAAIHGLRALRDPRAASPLVQALDDPIDEVARSAASTLGWLRSEDAVVALMRFYDSARWQNKVAAVYALGDIGHPQSLPLVRLALFHPFRKVRRAAKAALSSYDLKRRTAMKKHAAG
jgi:HEAT repeat protein